VLLTAEKELVMFTVSHLNGCAYCKRAHRAALRQQGLPESAIVALEQGESVGNARFDALAGATRLLIDKRAKLSAAEYGQLVDSGIDRIQQLELIAFIALKTITNYTNSLNECSKTIPDVA
jgi:AhpD family alkylhydroperoxidase